ncbi:MAG: DNA polymerase III subunit beta [Bacteroidetes bacterium]|nr:DNA polymerase III subunit beta [Bacteroidota bacterium]
MKFIVSSSGLLRQLQALSGVLNTSNPLPILDNFLFIIEKGTLTISASDLETTMITHIPVESKASGKVAVQAKILLDTLKTFPEQPLTFSIDEKTHQVEISSDYGKYKLSGFDADEFPKMPVASDTSTLSVSSQTMLQAISKTIFATGNDELRPVMSGVFCQLSKDDITFVATDAHKLVRYKRGDAKSNNEAAFILPKKPLTLLKNILTNTENEIKIRYNNTNAFFEIDNTTLICRLIDGRYPNYEAVIPVDNPNKLTIDRQQFLNAIRRVGIFSSKTTHQVKLKITGSELQLNAEDVDFSNEATERLTCQYNGEDMEIGFNVRFLADMLSNLDSTDVTIEMSAPNRAGIITPSIEGRKINEDILMLVMPVMLNS